MYWACVWSSLAAESSPIEDVKRLELCQDYCRRWKFGTEWETGGPKPCDLEPALPFSSVVGLCLVPRCNGTLCAIRWRAVVEFRALLG